MSDDAIEDLESFRAPGPRASIRANLPAGHRGAARRVLRNDRHRRGGAGRGRPRPRAPAHAVRRRPRRHLRPARVRRPGPHARAPAGRSTRSCAGYEFPTRSRRRRSRRASRCCSTSAPRSRSAGTSRAILKGEEIWMQFLSEPSGGSDVAGALTTAVRDGDEWVLNGSKVWTTGAWWSDWALCLARTNWDVPKHRGLTVFMLPIRQPGIEVHRIEMLNGIEGVLPGVPDRRPRARLRPRRRGRRRLDRRHPVDVPRAHALQLAARHHARRRRSAAAPAAPSMLAVAARRRPARRPAPATSSARPTCSSSSATRSSGRVGAGHRDRHDVRPGRRPSAGCSSGCGGRVGTTIAFELAGAPARRGPTTTASWPSVGNDFLMRQVGCIGGGTTEMAAQRRSASGCSACRASARSTATSPSATSPGAPHTPELSTTVTVDLA